MIFVEKNFFLLQLDTGHNLKFCKFKVAKMYVMNIYQYMSFNFLLNISLSSKNETNVSFVPKLGPNFNFKMENKYIRFIKSFIPTNLYC